MLKRAMWVLFGVCLGCDSGGTKAPADDTGPTETGDDTAPPDTTDDTDDSTDSADSADTGLTDTATGADTAAPASCGELRHEGTLTWLDIDGACPDDGGLLAVDGNLTLSGDAYQIDLSQLGCVCEVSGDVRVLSNPALLSLEGLDQLERIGGDLQVQYNPLLERAEGLGALTSIGGDVLVTENEALAWLTGLSAVASIGGELRVEDNPALLYLYGLEAVVSVGGALTIRDNSVLEQITGLGALTDCASLDLSALPYLSELSGLSSLASAPGGVRVEDTRRLQSLPFAGLREADFVTIRANTALAALPSWPELQTTGELLVEENNRLEAVSLPGLATVDGAVSFQYNRNLSAIALDGLLEAGELRVENNDRLESLHGPDSLTVLTGELSISQNDALTSLSGFEGLERVGSVSVNDNALSSFTGLSALTDVSELVLIAREPELETLSVMPSLTAISELYLQDLERLDVLGGFTALTAIGGDLSIVNCGLGSLDALANVETVGGTLGLSRNAGLAALPQPMALREVGALYLYSNSVLADVTGLHDITAVAGDMSIQSNDVLPPVEVQLLIDAIGEENIGGTVTAENNGSAL